MGIVLEMGMVAMVVVTAIAPCIHRALDTSEHVHIHIGQCTNWAVGKLGSGQ